MANEYLLIIDGSSLLSTQFYGNIPKEVLMGKTLEDKEKYFHKIMQTSKGVYTNAVYGFLRALFAMLENQKPTHLAVTWDITRNTFRREMYADYKANRSETLIPLASQFALMQQVLEEIGIPQFMSERYEADDYSGTLARRFEDQLPVRILTKDHDYLQLADEQVTIWLLQSAQSKADELFQKYGLKKDASCPDKAFPMNPERIEKEYGIKPTSVAALKGLEGDKSDNIKGVPGIGEQTAVSLIARYETVQALYEAIDANSSDNYKSLTDDWKVNLGIKRNPISYLTKTSEDELVGREAAFLSETLATIKTDIELDTTLDDLQLHVKLDAAKKCLRELEISSIRLPNLEEGQSISVRTLPNPEPIEVDDFSEVSNVFEALKKKERIGVSYSSDMNYLSLFDGEKLYRIFCRFFITEEYLEASLKGLQTAGVMVCGFDLKALMPMILVQVDNAFDVSLSDYLIHPLTSEHGFSQLASIYFDSVMDETPENAAIVSFMLMPILQNKMELLDLTKLYREIELPLIHVLFEMEKNGIIANRDELTMFGKSMEETIRKEEQVIYDLAGEKFTILSPKQLGEILFEKLKLPNGKKTKTGYSTSADILEKLVEEHPIVSHVLTYRQLTKLKNTYVESLGNFIESDGRIHCKFNQMVTATGRLSSAEPNLQNIPIRTELGRLIRKVFVPKPGYVFVDADYSQIELRLLAHMSGDDSLIQAFRDGEDIHRLTASKVFGKELSEVTAAERSAAKAVNFGIIYGISSFGLGQDLNISRFQANEYIKSYFEKYPSIKSYLDRLVQDAKNEKVAKTMYGRIRPIPELESENFMQRSFGERVAMNMPIQGTAADIMKIAMLRTYEGLKNAGLESKLLVQVHDELLIEAKEEEVEKVKEILSEAMEGAAKLSVPLSISISEGKSWYEAK